MRKSYGRQGRGGGVGAKARHASCACKPCWPSSCCSLTIWAASPSLSPPLADMVVCVLCNGRRTSLLDRNKMPASDCARVDECQYHVGPEHYSFEALDRLLPQAYHTNTRHIFPATPQASHLAWKNVRKGCSHPIPL